MKSRKGLFLVAVVLFSGLFFAFKGSGNSNEDETKRRKLLTAVGSLLESEHYSPKPVNDAFSKQIFKKYLDELDGEKNIFLKQDIDALKKFETTIDDEIHGGEIKFVPTVSALYEKRFNEVVDIKNEILEKPFDFTTNETFITDGDKLNYPSDAKERKERIRKMLKYLTLERFVDLQDQRTKSVVDSVKNRTDVQLEKEARDKVKKSIDKINKRYKATIKEEDKFNEFVNVIANLMDPHTDYFPPVEKRAFDEQMSGRFFGIGAQLQEQDGYIKITSLMPGYPAFRSGELVSGDVILKVAQGSAEPVEIAGYEVQDAVKLIRGSKGTEVRLTVKKQDGIIKVVSLIRDEIVQDEGFARSAIIKQGNDRVGYIYLPDFYANFEDPNGARCSEDVAKEIIKLKAEKIDGLILDLRSNGGGSLYEVVQMVGLFIDKGPVVQVRDKNGRASALPDNNSGVLYDGPLTVMVNELSASASEIFAAAIQDYKRGVIVGSSSTYGKGTVQKNVSFGKPIDFTSGVTEFGAVKLTFQKFYRINGGSTQLKGVTPDVVLPDSYEYLKIREKDNPISMPWDEIPKSQYQLSNDNFGYNTVIEKANNEIKKDSAFNLIKNNSEWLSKNADKPVELNINKYKENQKLVRSTLSQTSEIVKLKKEMNVEALQADQNKFYNNPDTAKGERYKAWLKSITTDKYINQTTKIVEDMVLNKSNTALIK